MQGGCLDLYTPRTEEEMGRLVVRLQSVDTELSGNSEQTVLLQSDPLLVLVSTDKAQYKPGQHVHFRVLSLKHTLRPHNEQVPVNCKLNFRCSFILKKIIFFLDILFGFLKRREVNILFS